jgi:mono/diheme cytochrome c family protein
MKRLFPLLLIGCIGQYVRKTTDERVDASAERLARGRYLVDGPGACGVCHTTWVNGNYFEGESDAYLAGGNYIEAKSAGYAVWVPNITPDANGGIGRWTDDQLMRAIRDGVHADGHLLLPFMPFNDFQHLSDDDLRAVVAYLRSVPPRQQTRTRLPNKVPGMMGFFLRNGAAHHKPVLHVAAPAGDKISRGKYLAEVAQCPGCHALGDRGEVPEDDPNYMAGSSFALERGIGKVWASNLTPGAIGRHSAEEIRAALTSGERLDGGKMASPMAERVPHLAKMTPEDLDALVAWLQSLKPSSRKVPPRELNDTGKKRFQ